MLVFHARIYYGHGSKFLRARGYSRSKGPSLAMTMNMGPYERHQQVAPMQKQNYFTMSDDRKNQRRLLRLSGPNHDKKSLPNQSIPASE